VHASVDRKREDVRDLCRRYGVARLDVFGSAARGRDFDEAASDVDFLVEFEAPDDELARYLDFRDALTALFGRAVDLVDRKEIEASRNYIRQRAILTGVEPIYAA
jgi:predicted nucleotidyltransferase